MKTILVKLQILLLLVSGSLLTFVGISVLVSPAGFYESSNIDIGANVSLLNELKAPAGLLLVAGLFMIAAIFVKGKSIIALQLATLIYLSYAATRMLSMVADGVPASGLVMATALEAGVGLACLMALWAGRASQVKLL